MTLDHLGILLAVFGLLAGAHTLYQASRYIRHSGPWTRRVRQGLSTIALSGLIPFLGSDSPLAWPVLFVMMISSFWPSGDGGRRLERDESAALRPTRDPYGPRR